MMMMLMMNGDEIENSGMHLLFLILIKTQPNYTHFHFSFLKIVCETFLTDFYFFFFSERSSPHNKFLLAIQNAYEVSMRVVSVIPGYNKMLENMFPFIPQHLEGARLMEGFNGREGLFFVHDRITNMETVFDGHHQLTTGTLLRLSDEPGKFMILYDIHTGVDVFFAKPI